MIIHAKASSIRVISVIIRDYPSLLCPIMYFGVCPRQVPTKRPWNHITKFYFRVICPAMKFNPLHVKSELVWTRRKEIGSNEGRKRRCMLLNLCRNSLLFCLILEKSRLVLLEYIISCQCHKVSLNISNLCWRIHKIFTSVVTNVKHSLAAIDLIIRLLDRLLSLS